MTNTPPADIVYTPAEVSRLTLEAVETRERTKEVGIRLGISVVDDVFLPMRPGELITVLALSSNFKTGLMQHVARKTAAQLDPEGNECVIYVTWEVAVEELGMIDLANATQLDISDLAQGKIKDWDSLKRAAIKRGTQPIYVIGHSIARRKSRPVLTMTNIARAVAYLEDALNLRPRLSILDYLQRMEPEGDGEPRLLHSRNVDRAKNMALATGAPVLLGCQAKQEVMDRRVKLPRINDGMETSNVMHSSDKIISLWRPVVTDGQGASFEMGGKQMSASEELLIMGLSKQRFGKVGDWWPLRVDFAKNEIQGVIDYSLGG